MTDYKIMYAVGLGSSTFTTLATLQTDLTYTAKLLTPGTFYSFKVYARNAVEYSLGSTAKTILAA